MRLNIEFNLSWVPRDGITLDNWVSKECDSDNWAISPHIVDFVNARWGSFTSDLFAGYNSFKVTKFYSKYWTLKCAEVDVSTDAFAFSRLYENCWITPPVVLGDRVIEHALHHRNKGVFIVPKWRSAIFGSV